jgi:hypothetical protein
VQKYTSEIDQVLDDQSTNPLPSDRFSNNAEYSFYDFYVSAHYKTQIGKLTLSPGVTWHNYLINDIQPINNKQSTKQLLLPDFYARYKFGGAKSLSLNYTVNAEFTDIQNVGNATLIRSYNSLFNGNRNLTNLWYHSVDLRYMDFNMYNFTNFYAMLNYQKRYNDISESVGYSDTDRLSVPTNAVLANDIFRGSVSFQKRYSFMKAKVSADLSYSNLQNTVELEQNRNRSFSQTYKVSAESNFSVYPNLEIGLKSTTAKYQSTSIDQTYITNSPYASLEAVMGSFLLAVDYTYTNYKTKQSLTSSTYDFLKAAIYYRKEGSDWEFKLSGTNLLNTEEIRRDSFSNNMISTYKYFVQPRTILLSVKFDL